MYYIVTRDGDSLPTRDKTSLQGNRVDQLEVMFRMANRDLWESIAGTGFKLQVAAYWEIMLEEAQTLRHQEGSVFYRARKLTLLGGTALARDIKVLESFMIGDFGQGGITLSAFCTGAAFSLAAQPCIKHNAALVGALEVVEVALEVLFSEHFAGVCAAFVEALKGHVRPLRYTNSGLLVHTVEMVFVKYFRVIRREKRALEYPLINISKPAGCAALLRSMLKDAVTELADFAKAHQLEKNFDMIVRLRNESVKTSSSSSSTGKSAAAENPGKEKGRGPAAVKGEKEKPKGVEVKREKGEPEQCGSHLGEMLGAVRANKAAILCRKGGMCKYKHGSLSDLTQESAKALAAEMPEWLRTPLLPLIASCREIRG